ncbi:hypothetical protein HYS94_02190 [Candidatus Daviesbacteria bacterium]|nr:hypothetical protein [Candidatus Daviesbacteria bacterium]
MPNDVSLQEFIAQARRGVYSGALGPDWLSKQTYFTVDTATGIFNTVYGKKIWHALNNQTRVFNALPRVVWGNVPGWRVRTDRGAGRSRPVTETGTLPTIDISDIQVVSSLPRWTGTTFGTSTKAIFSAQMEGGVGDVLAMESENAQIDHIKEINQEMLAASGFLVSTGAATTFTVPAAVAFHFKIGDAVGQHDVSAGAFDRAGGSVVSAVNTGTGVVTVATGTAFADGDVAFIHSRAGFTSLDDAIEEDVAAAGTTGIGGGANRVRAYDLTIGGRTAGTWNAGAVVSRNSGVGRDLTLNLVDTQFQGIRQNGGEPRLIVTGHDQYFRMQRLLNTVQRYLGQEEYQVGVGNERTYPGTRTGLVLATYQMVPILTEVDCPVSVSTADVVLGRNMYVLDTDYIEIAIAQPTQYIENKDYFAANALVVRGLLTTAGEMRVRNIWTQGKIADLSA